MLQRQFRVVVDPDGDNQRTIKSYIDIYDDALDLAKKAGAETGELVHVYSGTGVLYYVVPARAITPEPEPSAESYEEMTRIRATGRVEGDGYVDVMFHVIGTGITGKVHQTATLTSVDFDGAAVGCGFRAGDLTDPTNLRATVKAAWRQVGVDVLFELNQKANKILLGN